MISEQLLLTESATNAAILRLNSSRLNSFRTYVVCPRTQYINPRAQIRMYDVENVVALLNSHDDELMLDHLVEIRKQSAIKQAEEPEPEPKYRTMRVLKMAESRGITAAGIRIFEDTFERAASSNNYTRTQEKACLL